MCQQLVFPHELREKGSVLCFFLESQQVEKFIIYNKTFLVSGKFNSAQTSVQI